MRVRPFGRLLGTYTLNDLGDSIGVVALAILVFDRTDDVAAIAGFFLAAKFLPALVATGLTAHLDRRPLRHSLPLIYILEAMVFGVLALLAADDEFSLSAVLLLGFIDGTLAITGRGLTRGAVAATLQPHELLSEGNALMNLGFAFASVFGAALAGALIAAFGLSAALLVDAATFLVIALVLASTSRLPVPEHEEPQPWRERLGAGFAFARGSRPVRLLLGGQALALICFTLIVPIEVIYAKQSLGTSNAGYGLLLSAWGAGIVLGSLLYLALKQRSSFMLIVLSSAAVGLAYLGMSQAATLWVACAVSVVGGAGNGIQWVAVLTAVQEVTPSEYQARVSGLLESLGAAMPGVGYFVGGAIVALSSPRVAYAVAGGGIIVLVIAALAGRPSYERRGAALTPQQRPGAPSGAA